MEKDSIILVNTNSNNSKKIINYLKRNNKKFYSDNDVERSKFLIKNKLNEGSKNFIICGGDGSINKFINEYGKLSKEKKEKISLGIIPCGRANDLARSLKIPFKIEEAFKTIENKKTKRIDLIKVNNSYFITGGGLGLPTEIIKDVNSLSRNFITRAIKRIFGQSIYLWITLKKFIFGYKGIEEIKNKLLAIYVLNQSFIGKQFNIAPEAKNNDGYFEVKIVKMPPTFLSNFKTLSYGSKGKIDELSWIIKKKTKNLTINLKEPSYFMGDGELLEKSNKFNIEVIPNAVKIITD